MWTNPSRIYGLSSCNYSNFNMTWMQHKMGCHGSEAEKRRCFALVDFMNDLRLKNISAFITRTLYPVPDPVHLSESDSEALSCSIHPERPCSCSFLLTTNTSLVFHRKRSPTLHSNPPFTFVISRQVPVDYFSPAWPSCSSGITICHQWGLAVLHNIDQVQAWNPAFAS